MELGSGVMLATPSTSGKSGPLTAFSSSKTKWKGGIPQVLDPQASSKDNWYSLWSGVSPQLISENASLVQAIPVPLKAFSKPMSRVVIVWCESLKPTAHPSHPWLARKPGHEAKPNENCTPGCMTKNGESLVGGSRTVIWK